MLTSSQRVEQALLLEEFGPFVCAFRLCAIPGGLRYEQEYAALRLFGWRFRLPTWIAPRVNARIVGVEGGADTQVEIGVSLLGPVLSYRGITRPVAAVKDIAPPAPTD